MTACDVGLADSASADSTADAGAAADLTGDGNADLPIGASGYDGDGQADLAVGASGDSTIGPNNGKLAVFFGPVATDSW